jgi:Kef-type K+ transport system membrane component KefB/Trk K+ transport system NAD-binding subunit
MENSPSFIPLLLVLLLAFLVPILLSRFKQLRLPIVVGEILAGVLVGQSGLGWVQGDDPILGFLAEFGFVFLMFLSGMEIDFSNLGSLSLNRSSGSQRALPVSQSPLWLGGASFGITLIISTIVGYGLFSLELCSNPWMVALILSTTSLGVVLPVLKENGLTSGKYGQALLVAALIADFATMLLITVLVAELSHGLTPDILLIGLLFVAFFLIFRLGNFFFNRISAVRQAMDELSHATAQIKVRASFTMMLVFVVLSQMLGTELILGAFLAGAMVSLLRKPADAGLSHQLESIGFGFLIPIFFIKVGVDFNLQSLLASSQSLLLVPLLLVGALIVKSASALVFRRVFSWRETWAAGALLSSRLSLIIAASAIGLRLGVISEAFNSAIILVAILTVTGAPVAFTRILGSQAAETVRPVIVAGAGPLGRQVAQKLLEHHEWVVIVDSNVDRVDLARRQGLQVLHGHLDVPASEIERLLNQARSLVCTIGDADINYRICQTARLTFGIDHVISHVNSPKDIPRFELLGVTAINAALDRASLLAIIVRNPTLYELLASQQQNKEISEVLALNPQYLGRSLRDLHLPGDVLMVAMRRDGELIVPHGDTRIEAGDFLTLMGSQESIDSARLLFEQEA